MVYFGKKGFIVYWYGIVMWCIIELIIDFVGNLGVG